MRALLALLLSLILALASQTEAVARSEMAGATDQVLCGAGGAVSVTFDATGHALHRHPCTHCRAAAEAGDLPGPATLPLAPLTQGKSLTLASVAQAPGTLIITPSARAPPVLLA